MPSMATTTIKHTHERNNDDNATGQEKAVRKATKNVEY